MQGSVTPAGALRLKKTKRQVAPGHTLNLWEILKYGFPNFGCSKEVALFRLKNLPNLWRGMWRVAVAKALGIPTFYGQLSLTVIRGNGQVVDLGLVSLRVVTTVGVNFIRDAFLGTEELEDFDFHGFGTGTNAEAAANTALQTELTTQYATDNTRPTGTPSSGGTGAYQTVATLSPDATVTIAEHGIFDQASNAGGVLLDRSQFTGVPLTGGADSLQATYTISFPAGS
jgi:hypothetical protein